PLLDDLHVEQPEEAAAEAEAERDRRLWLKRQRRVVQLQLLERFAQQAVLATLDRVESGEHHRLGRAVARQRLGGRAVGQRDRVTDLAVGHVLQPRRYVAHLA